MKHNARVIGAMLSDEGNIVLTWSWDGTARLWDAGTGDPISRPMRHEGIVVASFGNEGHSILTWSNKTGSLRRWDLPDLTNMRAQTYIQQLEIQTGVTLGPNGQATVLSSKQWKDKKGGY